MKKLQGYRFECVWPDPAAEICDDVVRFWVRESAMRESVGRERSRQLLVVARDADDQVAAVSTAYPKHVQALGFSCFFFRSFVGSRHRSQGLKATGLIQQMVHRSYQVLNARFRRGVDPTVLGLYFEIENRSIQTNRPELVWNDLRANIVFIGRLSDGRHARVWYFEGACLP